MELATKLCSGASCDTEGAVVAVVARFDTVDADGDVTVRDAFADGTPVLLSGYGHSAILAQQQRTGTPVEPPVGKGALHIEGHDAVFRGRFFSTARGQEARQMVRELGDLAQWSYSFWVRDKEPAEGRWRALGARQLLKRIEPFEVSPVTLGAGGRATRTVSAKGCGCGDGPALTDLKAIHRQVLAREIKSLGLQHPRLPTELLTFTVFAADHLGIPLADMPKIRMVKAFPRERTLGTYTPDTHAIRIRDNLAAPDMRRTIAHELGHALEALKGRDHTEAFAEAAAEDVLAAWNRYTWRDVA